MGLLKRFTTKSRPQRRRFWTVTAFGQQIIATEQQLAERYLNQIRNDVVIELSTLEIPLLHAEHLGFSAAHSSWRSPVIATLDEIPVQNRSVDLYIWRYLPLVHDVRRDLLNDIARSLAPGGHLVVHALNPMHSQSWRCFGISNISDQAAGSIVPLARAAGLRVLHRDWSGPGWWRLRGLQSVLLQKTTPGLGLRSSSKKRAPQRAMPVTVANKLMPD